MKTINYNTVHSIFRFNVGCTVFKSVVTGERFNLFHVFQSCKKRFGKVAFVEKVQVDIKNQQYNMTLKQGAVIDFDALSKAVEDAGFSVASFKVTCQCGEYES